METDVKARYRNLEEMFRLLMPPLALIVPFKRLMHLLNVAAERHENGYVSAVAEKPSSSLYREIDSA